MKILANLLIKKKEIKFNNWKEKEKLPLFTDNVFINIFKKALHTTNILIILIREFSKFAAQINTIPL